MAKARVHVRPLQVHQNPDPQSVTGHHHLAMLLMRRQNPSRLLGRKSPSRHKLTCRLLERTSGTQGGRSEKNTMIYPIANHSSMIIQ
jgi:hypothetical protein